jgi:serine/threonine-protein kinase
VAVPNVGQSAIVRKNPSAHAVSSKRLSSYSVSPDPVTGQWPAAGQRWFGRYLIEKEIGWGGTSVVFLARDDWTSQSVALKVLRSVFRASVSEERFVREIALMRQVTHPHVMRVYDHGVEQGTLFYVMPFISGETLRHHMSRGAHVPLLDQVRVLSEVASAVDHLHRFGFVHRDIKPENVYLADGVSILADLGSAVDVHQHDELRLTAVGCCLGTPEYMSPEQFWDTDRIGPASDVYSLACLAFELFSGHTPFTARSAHGIATQHLSKPIPAISGSCGRVFRTADAVFSRALAKEPDDRYASCAEFVRHLRCALVRGLPVQTIR